MHFLMGSSTFSVIFKEMNESTNKEDPSAQTKTPWKCIGSMVSVMK